MEKNYPYSLQDKHIIAQILILVMLFSFAVRLYPHTLVYRFMNEEPYNYITVNDIITTGAPRNQGFYPILEHQIVAYTSMLFNLDPISVATMFNPLISALTAIPIFMLFKKYLKQEQALLISIFWCFSEAVFYRSAGFYSTEPLGLFFMFSALYFYSNKQYAFTAFYALLTIASHMLPFVVLAAIIAGEKFIFSNKKLQYASALAIVALFVYSPFNPYRRIVSIINIEYMLSKLNFSNVFSLYNAKTLETGMYMFFGTFVLFALTLACAIQLLIAKKLDKPELNYLEMNIVTRLSISMLAASVGLIAFSWVVYNSMLFAPPRLLVYAIVPLSFFTSVWLFKPDVTTQTKITIPAAIIMIMLFASSFGLQTMLWTDDALTKDEYLAIDDIQNMKLLDRTSSWWCDYPVTVELTSRTPKSVVWETDVSPEVLIDYFARIADSNSTLTDDLKYIVKYIYLSERMTKSSMFVQFTATRTLHVRRPTVDIWNNNINWKLIYHDHGVKVYERITS